MKGKILCAKSDFYHDTKTVDWEDFKREMEKKFPKQKPFPYKSNTITGWICPRCGAGLSPFTPRCGCQDTRYWGQDTVWC